MITISNVEDFHWEFWRLAWGQPREGRVLGWKHLVYRLWWRL